MDKKYAVTFRNSPQKSKASSQKASNQQVFGIHAIIEAIESGKEIESLYVQRDKTGELIGKLKQLAKDHRVPVQLVPVEKLNRLTRKNHQGAIAFISPIIYRKIDDIIPEIYEKGEMPLVMILDQITDVRNLGAIARSAECAGVHAIVLPYKGSAAINPDTIKTSAGGLFHIPVCRHESLNDTAKFLSDSGLQIIAASEKGEKTIYDVDFNRPTCIILGSEDKGVSNDLLRGCDEIARIPMNGQTESLNVSVSAGVVVFEAIRQRL
ncbi:MAG TPA: 23S rRNA (guanosine(2251)-2'-O)-methyltransferase RlmB [Candidatus Sphingobacterium stercoripullorum]|uniref:23S rRNA (Guanosine(2251)-2'-O)-methyltransferase RlmB n=1 Tax=Candidatus Sphingobacterium stercoripullorum TaxID=2838759 RepID=A0A9D2B0B8_9SPHI|nr:23S rRNA (guanosine(2251)-2'-O)-methyltransferase RlmB [Candidatus Sphingobacterium stercoripullorum]HLR50771.1 23S rRNA (guanosine(2251)-2'-O)-methyltransferase RlmB [Candidatus Sphingobacterium stercoripullorum]